MPTKLRGFYDKLMDHDKLMKGSKYNRYFKHPQLKKPSLSVQAYEDRVQRFKRPPLDPSKSARVLKDAKVTSSIPLISDKNQIKIDLNQIPVAKSGRGSPLALQ